VIIVTVETKKHISNEGSKVILKNLYTDHNFKNLKKASDFFGLKYHSLTKAKSKRGKIFPFTYKNYTFNETK
jgi:hypothetical protein